MVLSNGGSRYKLSMQVFGNISPTRSLIFRIFFIFLKKVEGPSWCLLNSKKRRFRVSMVRGIRGPKSSFFNSKIVRVTLEVGIKSKGVADSLGAFNLMLKLLSTNFFSIKSVMLLRKKFYRVAYG